MTSLHIDDRAVGLPAPDGDVITVGDALAAWHRRRGAIAAAAVASGIAAYGATWLMTPTYVADGSIIVRQDKRSSSADLLMVPASMHSGSIKNLAEQYIGLMKSATVADHIVARFDLQRVYGEPLPERAREALANNTEITSGAKDGVIAIEVSDSDPARAAAIANAYVDGLREMAQRLAVTDARRRRQFFESRMPETLAQLAQAEVALRDGGGFDPGALRYLPVQSASAHERMAAQASASEIALETARASLGDDSPDVARLHVRSQALREQLARDELDAELGSGHRDADYIGRVREFDYRRMLYEQLQRQLEQARVDEGREGPLIQQLDTALPPQRKARPYRSLIALGAAGAGLLTAALASLVHRPRGASTPGSTKASA